MENLKPCPFCGSESVICQYQQDWHDCLDMYRVFCKGCHSSSEYYELKEDAITAWNRRAEP